MQIIADASSNGEILARSNSKAQLYPFTCVTFFFSLKNKFLIASYCGLRVSIIDHRVVIVAGRADQTEPAPKSAGAQKVEVSDIKNIKNKNGGELHGQTCFQSFF